MIPLGTVNELIESASRRGNIPNSQMTYMTSDFLAMMNEELMAYAMPLLHARREDYYLEEVYFDVNTPDAMIGNPSGSQDRAWLLPEYAMASSLRDVQAVSPSGGFYNLARIETDQVPNSVSQGWYFYGNYLALHYNAISAAPPPLSIRCIFHVRNNTVQLVEKAMRIDAIIVPGEAFNVSMAYPQAIQSQEALDQCFHVLDTPIETSPGSGVWTCHASFSLYPNEYYPAAPGVGTAFIFDVADKYTWKVKTTALTVAEYNPAEGTVDPENPTWTTYKLQLSPTTGQILPSQGDWLVPDGLILQTFVYDFINGRPAFEVLARNIPVSISPLPISVGADPYYPTWSQYRLTVNPGTFPMTMPTTMPSDGPPLTVASAIKVGDWISLTGSTPVVPLPLELHALLAQRMVVKFLEAQGDQEQLEQSRKSLSEMANQVPLLINPRVEGKPKKLVNAIGHWRRWRW
jgi:hypothetical protein